MEPYYLVDVYLPQRVSADPRFITLRKQWSAAFGGTTRIMGCGMFKQEAEEDIAVYRIYMPSSLVRDDVVSYFAAVRKDLEKTFSEEKEFLITFSEGHYFV